MVSRLEQQSETPMQPDPRIRRKTVQFINYALNLGARQDSPCVLSDEEDGYYVNARRSPRDPADLWP